MTAKRVPVNSPDPFDTCAIEFTDERGRAQVRHFHTEGGLQRFAERHGLRVV